METQFIHVSLAACLKRIFKDGKQSCRMLLVFLQMIKEPRGKKNHSNMFLIMHIPLKVLYFFKKNISL